MPNRLHNNEYIPDPTITTAQVSLELSHGWMQENPALAVKAIRRFMAAHNGWRIESTTSTTHSLTLEATNPDAEE